MAMKNDVAARQAYGQAYDGIPKSVFALLAWHLANQVSGEADALGAAEQQLMQEINALVRQGQIEPAQARRPLKELGARVRDLNRSTDGDN